MNFISTPTMLSVTQAAGQFCASLNTSNVPPHISEKARVCIFYGLGIGLLCLPEKTAWTASESVLQLDGLAGKSGATCLVNGVRAPVSSAAFSNAVLLHARCQEDTSGTAHLGVAILSVALALLEAGLGHPHLVLESIMAGYEVGGALERIMGKKTMAAGFRASPLYGTIAAAACAARLMNLPAERIGAAIANAALFTGGTLQSIPEGTDEWRYQLGIAAKNGLQAAMLARTGSLSTQAAIEGPQGFSLAFARENFVTENLKLGDHWNLPAVTFKPYPVCAHNQTPTSLGAVLAKRISSRDIATMTLRINPYVVPGMLERGPFSRVPETLMSTFFCVAAAAVHGTVSTSILASFEDEDIGHLIPKMNIELDASLPFPSAAVDVAANSGERFTLTEMRTFEDYSFSCQQVREQLNRLLSESGIDLTAVDLLYTFAYSEGDFAIDPVLRAYQLGRQSLESARL
jgi:2-methylcitrate dehydratase PrpD